MKPEINQELFGRILEQIRKDPKSHEQSDWTSATECGTRHCIGGWAIHFAATDLGLIHDGISYYRVLPEVARSVGIENPENAGSDRTAAKMLGLDEFEADDLFYGNTNAEALELVEKYALKGREWQ